MKHYRFAAAICLLWIGSVGFSFADDNSMQYYQTGNTFYSQKNYDQAIRYYEAAVQMNPKLWQAYQGLGNCYYAKGDKTEALKNYEKCLDLNPDNPQLNPFVQNLRTQLNSAPPLPTERANAGGTTSEPKFVLAPMAGIGYCTETGYGLGFGGGLSGYFSGGNGLFFGPSAAFYTFSGPSYNYYGISESYSFSNIELLAVVKYLIGTSETRPYLIGGFGLSIFSANDTVSESGYGSVSTSASSSYPMLEVGGGSGVSRWKQHGFIRGGQIQRDYGQRWHGFLPSPDSRPGF